MASGSFIDTSGVQKVLDQMGFDSRAQKNIIRRTARKGGNILKDSVKAAIPNRDDYEHIPFIRRSVKTVTSRSRFRPGVNIIIKGGDVPVGQGDSRRFWRLRNYAHLVFYGSYKTPKRPHKKGPRKGIGQGRVFGIEQRNPFRIAQKRSGKMAMNIMSRSLIPEIQKEIKKLKRG